MEKQKTKKVLITKSFITKTILMILIWVLLLTPLYTGKIYSLDTSSREVYRPSYMRSIEIDESREHVIFISNDSIYGVSYKNNSGLFKEPEVLPSLDYADFVCWTDIDDGTVVNFPRPSESRLVVEAVFDVDYKRLTNEITTNEVKSTVFIINYNFIGIIGINLFPTSKVSIGSGVIFQKQNGYYYVMTNYHVANGLKDEKFLNNSIVIKDYLGNEYSGFFKEEYSSEELDIAVIVFKEGKSELKVQKFAHNNPKIGSDLILVGSPKGQVNAITYGKVLDYDHIELIDSEFLHYSLIHDVPSEGGSSGSASYNIGLRIVGIHFSGKRGPMDAKGNIGNSVPVVDILEHLNKVFWVN